MPKSPKVEALDHDRVIEMYVVEKKSLQAIADDFGVSTSPILTILDMHQVPRRTRSESQRHRPRIWRNPVCKADLIRLYCEEGLSLAVCAERLRSTVDWLQQLMEQWGIPRRKPWMLNCKWTQLDADKIVRLYAEEELTLKEIAWRYDVSETIIIKVLKHRGVPRRTASEAKVLAHKRRREKAAAEHKPECVEVAGVPDNASIESQIVSMRQDQNAKVQDIAASLNIETVNVFQVLQRAGLLPF